MIRLGVNIDHVATLRQTRGETYPDPLDAALIAQKSGAGNITAHLREDRRHIQDKDVFELPRILSIPLNFEMAATAEMLAIALKLRPQAVTLVPERRQELTTEGGLRLDVPTSALADMIQELSRVGIKVSLFIEPTTAAAVKARELGAFAVEFHTGHWCHQMDAATDTKTKLRLTEALAIACRESKRLGLHCHVGHGINYSNASWLQTIPEIEEANIGHAIISRAVFDGLEKAVREMKRLLNDPQCRPIHA